MRVIKRLLAMLLLTGVFIGYIPISVYAVDSPVHIYVEGYHAGKLELSWDAINDTDSIILRYNKPNVLIPETIALDSGITTYEISGLQDNYIYNIEIYTVKDLAEERKGLLYFLPGITFEVKNVPETMDEATTPPYDSNGGREIGTNPRLKLSWTEPKIYNGSTFVAASIAREYIEAQLNSVYNTAYDLTNLNYKINISQDSMDMSGNAEVNIIQDGAAGYEANVSGNTANTTNVNISGNKMELELIGRKDRNTVLPISEEDGELPHPDILPGTVYFMDIQTIIEGYQDAIVLGNDGRSVLKGNPFTYTPIRFQLSKDEFGNVYVKVYTVNQGALSLPNLYYEVQTNTSDSAYGWKQRAKIDPDYFKDSSGKNQEFGLIPIIASNTENRIYYRVVTTSDGNEAIRSQNLLYIMSLDKAAPPIPKAIKIIDREAVIEESSGNMSTDINISWEEPLNWKEIKENSDKDNDIYYCFMININQTDITDRPYPSLIDERNGIKFEDRFPATYRLVKYVNARSVLEMNSNDKIREENGRLEYTLKGFDLFTVTDDNGNKVDFSGDFRTKLGIEHDYPSLLLNNKVYYLQMFTVKGNPAELIDIDAKSSDRSITTSFTTLSGDEKEVILPENFKLAEVNGNTYSDADGKISNTVKLEFVQYNNIKWSDYTTYKYDNKIYYDLYMSTASSGGEIFIGSTDEIHADYSDKNNVDFKIVKDGQNSIITATINEFTKEPAITSFGYKLTPNTNYYFKLKTRLVISKTKTGALYPSEYEIKESNYSPVVPVTTVRGDMTPPHTEEKMPIAPVDFSIALDDEGNELLSSSSATFNWERFEKGVEYSLIVTSTRMPMNADPSQYLNDPVYHDFKDNFNIKDNDIGMIFDPGAPINQFPDNFTYINETNTCIYNMNEWLYPNRLYYFSLQAKNKSNGNLSPWICIPVTTKLIEKPKAVEILKEGELGVFWTEGSKDIRPEDYRVYIKGLKDKAFKLLSRSQGVVVRDSKTVINNNSFDYVFYARITGLELNSSYDIKVYKGSGEGTLVYQKLGAQTRNGYHEMEVKWRGLEGYSYELAIKADDEIEYTTLLPEDFEMYRDINGETNSDYLEETARTFSNEDAYFYARIKSRLVSLPDGRMERRLLESNKKYSIKVRAVKVDPVDTTLVSYSKYAGPVFGRTEFNQDDYDKDKNEEEREIIFLDKIKYLEESLFWRVNISKSSVNSVLIKDERVVNAIVNSFESTFSIDVTQYLEDINTDEVYIPFNVLKTLNSEGKNLKLKLVEGEYTIRPGTFDENTDEIKALRNKPFVQDILIKLSIVRKDSSKLKIIDGAKPVAKINDLMIEAIGISEKTDNLDKRINNKLYDGENGIVSEKLDMLLSAYTGSGKEAERLLDQYMNGVVNLVEMELSSHIGFMIDTVKTYGKSSVIGLFNKALLTKIYIDNKKGLKSPYVQYFGESKWQKISSNVVINSSSLTFNLEGSGKYTVLIAATSSEGIPKNHWAKKDIEVLISKYDLSKVFIGIEKNFAPDDIVTTKEMVLLYEVITDSADENSGLDMRNKIKSLGLEDIVSISSINANITKQLTAVLLSRMYCLKMNVDINSIKATKTIFIRDEALIKAKFKKYVEIVVDKDIFSLDGKGNYLPGSLLNRAQVATAVVRLLEAIGEG